ncbi:hypothetical protein MTR67_021998 [Solanum verrucosum]|uniref:Uncharacterized protein n=1 Tax=Solanum verrucosum TaxID=315347 RepID=A0AAF0TXE2_SOLVR|nr:hypothetical protein MTR67_021998 [Solanum verrucosum]
MKRRRQSPSSEEVEEAPSILHRRKMKRRRQSPSSEEDEGAPSIAFIFIQLNSSTTLCYLEQKRILH